MRKLLLIRLAVIGIVVGSLIQFSRDTLPSLKATGFDDAYMFVRYAKHLAAGAGFSWNVDDGPVYGATSFLYVLVIAAMRAKAGLPDNLVLPVTSFLAGVLACLALTILGFLFRGNEQIRKWWAPALVIPCMTLGYVFRVHSLSGMETTLSLLGNSILACCLVIYSTRRSKTCFFLCLFSAYVSFLVRPDNGLYCWLLPPLFLAATDGKLRRPALAYAALFGILLLLDCGLKKAVTGDVVPLAFFAKASGFYRGYQGGPKWNAIEHSFDFLIGAAPFLAAIIFFGSRRSRARLIAIFVPVAATFTYYATTVQIMGFYGRYYYPSLAFFVLGAFVAVDAHSAPEPNTPAPSGASSASRILAILVLLLVLNSSTARGAAAAFWEKYAISKPAPFQAQQVYRTNANASLPPLDWWRSITEFSALLGRMPSGVKIESSENGFIGAQHPSIDIIDLTGLNDRRIAHEGFSAELLFSRQPDLIWLPHPDYSYALKEILDSPVFVSEYEYYPSAYNHGLALRKTSAYFVTLQVILEKEFSRVYPGERLSDYRAEALDPGGR